MRDLFAPIIGGVDCSGLVNRYSLQCEPFDREGDNGGTLRNGEEIKDVLARKIRLSWTVNSMSSAQYTSLCYAVSGSLNNGVTATVFDPTINETRTAKFHVTLPAWNLAFHPPGMNPMSTAGNALILEEV